VVALRPGHKETKERTHVANTMAVTDADFQKEVLESTLPVVVDFWAPWCGPCRMVGPVVETLSREFDGQVRFVKVNVDENPEKAAAYGVQGIPTLLFFRDGEMVERIVGALPEPVLRSQVQSTFGIAAKA